MITGVEHSRYWRATCRVTRIYVPTADAGLACRRCWGLSYASQKQSYRTGGFLGALLGSWGKAETVLARERRRIAAEQRHAERRAILGKEPPYGGSKAKVAEGDAR